MRDCNEDDPCDHDDYDFDLLEGRAHCWRCGERWTMTAAQMDAHLRWETEYHESMEREYRRKWWDDLFWAVRHPIATIHWELQKRGWLRSARPATDDEIPF
jgi:hypothetical protein